MWIWYFVLLSAVLSLDRGGATQVVLDGPQLRLFPYSLIHFSNSVGLTLSCLPEGLPPLSITWLNKIGEELQQIPGIREQLPNGSLHFSPFSPEHYVSTIHTEAYRCSVRNPVGTFLSPVFSVRAILDHPFEVTIKTNGEWVEGSPALLECEVSSSSLSPFVQAVAWKEINEFGHEREVQLDKSKYHMNCDGSLLILSAKVQLFSCIAQNKLNKRMMTSPPFLLKSRKSSAGSGGGLPPKSIFSKNVICIESEHGSLVHGEISRTDLLCLGLGNPSPALRWEKRIPALLSGGGGGEVEKVVQLGWTGPLLQLPNSSSNETYHCEAHNAFGSYSVNYSISVADHTIPKINVEPGRILAKNGQTVEFTCRVEQDNRLASSQTTVFKWFKDGKPLPEGGSRVRATLQKLLIFNAHLRDQGVYQCFTKEATATGGGTLLFPSSAPELVHTFISQSLQPGPSLSLKCSAVGNPAPEISWEVDGLSLSDGLGLTTSPSDFKGFHSQHSRYSLGSGRHGEMTVSHLNISEVRVEDGGLLRCTASNIVASTVHTARLNVYGPIFVKEMVPLTLVQGETVQIPCHYGGFPVSKVVWEKDSRPIIETEGRTGSTTPPRFTVFPNGTLQIGRISTEQDKGSYTCRVSNRKGEVATGTVHVNVMNPPVISSFKFDSDLKERQRTSVSCNVISGDLPITINWWKDGQPIPRYLNVSENRVRFISFLIFDELRENHSGEYTCSASNAAAVAKESAKLEVRVPPKWTKVPENTKVILKSDHSLSCSAYGVPPPNISWFKEINGIKSELHTNRKYELGLHGTLRILGVDDKDSSTYTCEAINGIGNGISKSIRLDVIIPAKISASLETVLVAEGGTASLQCQIRGDRPVEVIWKKNSTVIQPPPQIAYQSKRKVLQKVIELNESVLSAQLEIEQSEMNDSDVYVCLASNQYGRDEDRITLEVKARPTPPEDFIVEEIGSRFIRLRWSKSASKSLVPITQFILEWRNSLSLPFPSWRETSTSGQVFNMSVQYPQSYAVIDGLTPVTNYQVRLFAWNDIGGSLPTEPLTVLTLPEAPSASPRNISAIPLSPKSLLVKWEPPEADFQHGAILGYQVIAQLQSSSLYSNGTVVVDQKWEQQSEFKGLRPNSPYRITIRAYNSAGKGPESSPFFMQTPEGAPESPPLNLQCESLSPKSLQVQWEPPPAHLSNGQILGYKVIYIPTQVGLSRMGEKPEVKKTSNRETTLHGLKSYTSYGVRILAYTAGGESETSKAVNCTTEEDVPEEPGDLKVLITSSTSVLVSWLPPHSPNGIITKYTIFWKSDETGLTREKQYVPNLITPFSQDHQPSFEIKKLREGQRYSFWISASNSAGLGRPSRTEVVQLSTSISTKIGARIASFSVSKNVLKDQSIRLPCRAVGSPMPKLTWLKDGSPIRSNSISRNASLFISRITNDDEGEYTCRAENEQGSDELHHGLIISRPPSTIQIFVGYVTDSSIQIHWEPPEKSDPSLTGYTLEYRKAGEGHEWQFLKLSSLLTSYSLEGLLCGSHYEIRLAAENSVGLGEPSNVAKARTNGAIPNSSPRLTEILDGNWTMIRIDLNRWPDGGCPLTNFQIEYGNDGTSEWMRIYRRDNATRVFTMQTEPERKYQIRIWVSNDAGSVSKTFVVEAHPDFFLNYAKVLERVEEEEKLNGGSSYVPFYTDPHVLVPIVSAVICTAALTVCVLMLIKRKKQSKPGWKYNASSNQQSWLSSSDQQGKCLDGGTEESMSIYATLNSTKPIPMTIRDSTVRLQSFGQHDNYDAPPNLMSKRESGSRDQLKKSRRKSKSLSSPLEEVCMEQVSCQMEFPNKIEPPREFRSSTSVASQQHLQYARSPHQISSEALDNSSEDGDDDHEKVDETVRRLSGRFPAVENEMLYHDYSCPYQLGGKQHSAKSSRPGTLKKTNTGRARNEIRQYFD